MKQVVVFTLGLGIVLASIPRGVAATPTGTDLFVRHGKSRRQGPEGIADLREQ